MSSRFSNRSGFAPQEPVITVRDDAPDELRQFVVDVIFEYVGFSNVDLEDLRFLVCRVLDALPNRNNWSEFRVRSEIQSLVNKCDWYYVYDIIEENLLLVVQRQKEKQCYFCSSSQGLYRHRLFVYC